MTMMNIQPTLAKMFSKLTTRLVIIFSIFIISVIVIIQGIQLFGIPFSAVNGRLEEERQEAFKNMSFIADLKENQLLRWMEEVRGNVHIAAKDYFIVSEVNLLRETTYELAGNNLRHTELLLQPGYKNHYEALSDHFNTMISVYGRYSNIQIVDPETGKILFSVDSSYVGVDISEEYYFKDSIETLAARTSDVLLLQQGASPVVYFTDIINNQDGELVAVLIAEVEIDKIIQSMLLTGEAMGTSGETVLVNQDSRILAPLKYPLPDGSIAMPLSFQIEALPATLAATGTDGIIESDDYRNIPVLAAFRHIRVASDLGWGMVVKIDQTEIFAPLQRELLRTVLIGLGSMIMTIILTIFIARRITDPIRSISDAAEEIAKGNLNIQVPVVGSYETSTAAKTFNIMVKRIKDVQEEMTRQERLVTLGQFSGNISHELRNPLGTIDASVYYLKRRLKDADEKVKANLDRIKSSVDSSTAIIESLLNLTRMKEPQRKKIGLLHTTSDALTTSNLPAMVNVAQNFPEQEVMIDGDREQLRMAFKNILKNAVDAMDGKGTLTITVHTTTEGWAEVSFADTGSGISDENIEKIFQPLFSTKAKGIGFGLSITRMIIDRHGGNIMAKSEPGKGATIVIHLPLRSDKAKEE